MEREIEINIKGYSLKTNAIGHFAGLFLPSENLLFGDAIIYNHYKMILKIKRSLIYFKDQIFVIEIGNNAAQHCKLQ